MNAIPASAPHPARRYSSARRALLTLAACGAWMSLLSCGASASTDAGIGPAFVMFLNLSERTALVISAGGITDVGGNGRFCLNVDPVRPNVVMFDNFTGSTVGGFQPSFRAGGRYTVFITGSESGALRFSTIQERFTPSAGAHGIRFFNGGSAAYDIYASTTDLPLTELTPVLRNVSPGTSSAYAERPSGTYFLEGSRAGTKSLDLYWPPRALLPGASTTLWLAPRSGLLVSGAIDDCTEASTRPAT